MESNKRPLIRGISAAMLAGGLAAGSCYLMNQKPVPEPIVRETVIHAIENETIRSIASCDDMDDLALRIPSIARKLSGADPDQLMRIFEGIRPIMLRLAESTRRKDGVFIDDLEMLGSLFERMETRDDRMAVVFLALPRLSERSASDHSTLDSRESSETLFIDELARHPGFREVSRVIQSCWHPEPGFQPTKEQELGFFRAFDSLY